MHYDVRTEGKGLAQAEASLGDHVTGGVVQRWRQVQKKLGHLLSEGTNPGYPAREVMFKVRLLQDVIESHCSFARVQARAESVLTNTHSSLV